ncbi:hypothetical protein BDZ45DRAFT_738277 [Acephala macrosclerotiorum]|nr:hypothetical protein BDZ45DRAFT_738277 [Acephala macrosclerotiorum]
MPLKFRCLRTREALGVYNLLFLPSNISFLRQLSPEQKLSHTPLFSSLLFSCWTAPNLHTQSNNLLPLPLLDSRSTTLTTHHTSHNHTPPHHHQTMAITRSQSRAAATANSTTHRTRAVTRSQTHEARRRVRFAPLPSTPNQPVTRERVAERRARKAKKRARRERAIAGAGWKGGKRKRGRKGGKGGKA